MIHALSTAPPITAPAAMVALAVLLVIASGWLLWRVRTHPSGVPKWLRLPGLAPPSKVTGLVAGLAGLVVAYHLFVHGAGFDQFRAPFSLAIGLAALAVIASLGVDALENKKLGNSAPNPPPSHRAPSDSEND